MQPGKQGKKNILGISRIELMRLKENIEIRNF